MDFDMFVIIADGEDDTEVAEMPSWMKRPERIIEDYDEALIYTPDEHSRNEIVFPIAKKRDGPEKNLLLIAIKSSTIGGKIELVATSGNVQPLKLDKRYYGNVQNLEGKMKIYEVWIPPIADNLNYIIELESCEGSAKIFISKSFKSLILGEVELQSSRNDHGKIYAALPSSNSNSQKYIIAIKSNNNQTGFEDEYFSGFNIEVREMNTTGFGSSMYIEKYFIPKNGRIDWELTSDGDIKLSWEKIYNSVEVEFKKGEV